MSKEWFYQRERTIGAIFSATTIGSLLPLNQKVTTVTPDATVSTVVQLLSTNRILSVPVVDATAAKKNLGFVDMFDILKFIEDVFNDLDNDLGDGPTRTIEHHQHTTASEGAPKTIIRLQQWCQSAAKLTSKRQEFAAHPIKDCINASKLNPYYEVHLSTSVVQLVKLFSEKSIHRVAVVNEEGSIVGIVSQSNIIKFMTENINSMDKAFCRSPLVDLGYVDEKTVVSMRPHARAINCFHQMISNGISAVAITDENGEFLTNLSISDLRGLNQDNLGALMLPVLEYIIKYAPDKKIPPVTAIGSTHLETALLKLNTLRVHRIWILDEKHFNKPIGVLSVSDVIDLVRGKLQEH